MQFSSNKKLYHESIKEDDCESPNKAYASESSNGVVVMKATETESSAAENNLDGESYGSYISSGIAEAQLNEVQTKFE